jgi:hypothetical protein
MRGAQITGVGSTAILKFHKIASDICGLSGWNLLNFLQLTPRILRWLLDFWNAEVFASYALAFVLQLRKKHGKPSGRVSRRVPVGTVETEYTEQNILII